MKQIQFQGHVASLHTGHRSDLMNAQVNVELAACNPYELNLAIPAEDAAHWLPGRQILVTVEVLPPPKED